MPAPPAQPTLDALVALIDAAHLATPDQLPDLAAAAGHRLGVGIVVYLVDYDQRELVPWPPTGLPPRPPLAISATLPGRAFRLVEPVPVTDPDAPRLWLPLLDGVERLGVLDVTLPAGTDPDDSTLHDALQPVAGLLGHLVHVKTPYGDAIHRVRRQRAHTVAAELLWQLLPPLTFGNDRLVVSGVLEPSYDVGGDAFDYAADADRVHLAVFDAMGHTLNAGIIAAVALAAYRNCRREGRGLFDTAVMVDDVLAERFGGERFATGILAQLDLDTGRLRYLAAGHPHPLVLRRGRVVKTLTGARWLPFGLGSGEGEVEEEWLEPEDAVVLYTDGVTEARDPRGAMFGLDRLIDFLERQAAADQPARETLRQVVHAVLDHQQGVLQDDATLLLAHWTTAAPHMFTQG